MTVETSAPFLRLFLAVALPDAIRAELRRAQSQLRRDAPPGAWRWTRPEQFHVTVKFLGDIPPEQLGWLEAAVTVVCAGFPALTLTAQGIGYFPSPAKPRVIWAGATDAGNQLAELHRQLDTALRPLNPAAPPEKFRGHITLGRIKPGFHGRWEKMRERASRLQEQHFGTWHATAVDLMRSELTAEGTRHILVHRHPVHID
ncbi:MAG TPA: RNA 2',3'-cyclic phosphodiesterase [Dongiaceae bacterium]|nr:RNA 2',3'-cyclic phosphodiesterase [Dongiaceae bacterium]